MKPGLGFPRLTQRTFTYVVKKPAVTLDLKEENDHCGEAHPEDGGSCEVNLFFYLVLMSDQRHEVRIWEKFALELLWWYVEATTRSLNLLILEKNQHIFKSIFPVLNSCLQDRWQWGTVSIFGCVRSIKFIWWWWNRVIFVIMQYWTNRLQSSFFQAESILNSSSELFHR